MAERIRIGLIRGRQLLLAVGAVVISITFDGVTFADVSVEESVLRGLAMGEVSCDAERGYEARCDGGDDHAGDFALPDLRGGKEVIAEGFEGGEAILGSVFFRLVDGLLVSRQDVRRTDVFADVGDRPVLGRFGLAFHGLDGRCHVTVRAETSAGHLGLGDPQGRAEVDQHEHAVGALHQVRLLPVAVKVVGLTQIDGECKDADDKSAERLFGSRRFERVKAFDDKVGESIVESVTEEAWQIITEGELSVEVDFILEALAAGGVAGLENGRLSVDERVPDLARCLGVFAEDNAAAVEDGLIRANHSAFGGMSLSLWFAARTIVLSTA